MSLPLFVLVAVVIIALFLYIRSQPNKREPVYERICNQILTGSGKYKKITVRKTNTATRTINKNDIHLITNRKDGTPFEEETLILVLIHELAHVISNESGHTPEFYSSETLLISSARDLYMVTDKSSIEDDYPCMNHY